MLNTAYFDVVYMYMYKSACEMNGEIRVLTLVFDLPTWQEVDPFTKGWQSEVMYDLCRLYMYICMCCDRVGVYNILS